MRLLPRNRLRPHRPQRRLEHERRSSRRWRCPERPPRGGRTRGLRTKTLEGRRIIPIAAGKLREKQHLPEIPLRLPCAPASGKAPPRAGLFSPHVPHPQGISVRPCSSRKQGVLPGGKSSETRRAGIAERVLTFSRRQVEWTVFPKTRVNLSKTQDQIPPHEVRNPHDPPRDRSVFFCALLSAVRPRPLRPEPQVSVPVESLIELGQEALLLSAAIFTLRTASLEKALSGGLCSSSAFLVALFIRELDGWIRPRLRSTASSSGSARCRPGREGRGARHRHSGLAHSSATAPFRSCVHGRSDPARLLRLYGMRTLCSPMRARPARAFYSVKTLSEESTELRLHDDLLRAPPSMQATACECAAAGPAPNAYYRRRPAPRPL